jgi:excisionase family DNA binding protein
MATRLTPPPDAPDLMTPAEVAALARVHVRTVIRWADTGSLTSVRTLGGHRRYRTAEVYALLNGEAYPAPGSDIPGQPGYVVAVCGHRVAGSEWRAGFRACERCPAETPNGGQR